jgi:hypothetical protein
MITLGSFHFMYMDYITKGKFELGEFDKVNQLKTLSMNDNITVVTLLKSTIFLVED